MSAYKLTIDYPNQMDGVEVQIDGLGIFQNGKSYKVEKEAAERFRQHHKRPVDPDSAKGAETSEETSGPTLLEAFKDNQYIKVETWKDGGK